MAKAAKQTAKTQLRTIKYNDKSGGQPQLVNIYNGLRQLLLQQSKSNLMVIDKPGQVHLHSTKTVEVLGKPKPNMLFASALVQKGYVGFYFMPVYSDVFLKAEIPAVLLKCLKGKACFHIKALDDSLKNQIKMALAAGYNCYAQKGWI